LFRITYKQTTWSDLPKTMKKSIQIQLIEHFQKRYWQAKKVEYKVNYSEDISLLNNLIKELLTKEIDSFFDKLPDEWYKDKELTLPMLYSEVMKRFNTINPSDIAKMLGGLIKEVPRSEPNRY
jgi:hypothetical protein